MTAPAPGERVNRWRVAVPQLGFSDWPSYEAARERADQWTAVGRWAVIRCWVEGCWQKWEQLQPDAEDFSGVSRTSPDASGTSRTDSERPGTETDTDA